MLPSAALSSCAVNRRQASARALADLAPRLGLPLWQAGELARAGTPTTPTAPTGWSALDVELPGGGWPLTGLTELLLPASASGELMLLAPWLQTFGRRELGSRELVWVAPPGLPCVAALQGLGLALPRLVCIDPATMSDAAWATEQALRSASCAAVLWWNQGPVASLNLRRLHLAAQAGATPLMALRPASARALSSPAPLRLSCTPDTDRRLTVEIFKRRGPPMAAPLVLPLPWPISARPLPNNKVLSRHAVDRPASAAPPAASPALVAPGV
ncbi:translesion DNA synthesis-associated protein ImuA [Methylibium sp.]|uniref:translesion DNA synthesis-associated protein ImuA n=1 Tax=Methylibium sp. TaxID=2067992 RepID=UPI0017DDC744|nr:translesion DNA synthesis-associated protein ImuA [Methylibium sp.]MBA3591830.1 translesion DNA synthesis-associated protein ImuA [Methylibium sp.]